MTRKTVKQLDVELSKIKEEHKTLNTKFDDLAARYVSLEKKYEESLNNKKQSIQCDICDKEFASQGVLNKHRKTHNSDLEIFKCDVCDKNFNEKWKLNAHIKSHVLYSCDQCERTFTSHDIKEKHMKISHENVKLYCYFYNNNLECPRDAQCIFLHDNSGICKYGKRCEREKCMYKHTIDVTEEYDDEENDIVETDDETENDGKGENDDNVSEKTFFNPSQSDSETEGFDKNEMNDDEEINNDNMENKNDANEKCVEDMMKC